jgi:hypothetical protein
MSTKILSTKILSTVILSTFKEKSFCRPLIIDTLTVDVCDTDSGRELSRHVGNRHWHVAPNFVLIASLMINFVIPFVSIRGGPLGCQMVYFQTKKSHFG